MATIEVYSYRAREPKGHPHRFEGEFIAGDSSINLYRLNDGQILVEETCMPSWANDHGGGCDFRFIPDSNEALRGLIEQQGNRTGPRLARQLGFADITEADWF